MGREATWPTSVLDIQSGRADIFFGFAFSPERAQAMDLIGPLYEVPEVAVLGSRRTSSIGSYAWSDLNKSDILSDRGDGHHGRTGWPQNSLPNATMRAMKNFNDAVLDVQSGNAKAPITSAIIGFGTLSSNPRS